MGGFSNVTLHQFLPRLLSGLVLWCFQSPGLQTATLMATVLGLLYWPDRAIWELVCLRVDYKIGKAKIEYMSHRWILYVVAKSFSLLSEKSCRGHVLLYRLWLVKSANNQEFKYSHFQAFLPRIDFSRESVTRCLPLH